MRIQIAGIIDQAEADSLVKAGVNDLGFPLGPGIRKLDLTEHAAMKIIDNLRPGVHGVLITYLETADEIKALGRKIGATKIQLHGEPTLAEIKRLREICPGIHLIKSLVIGDKTMAELEIQVQTLAPHIEEFLTDTFDPHSGARGATGKVHDWRLSRKLVEISPRPVILAGGLTAENVADAIRAVRPAAVDSHTGVEGVDGRKDIGKVLKFIQQSHAAFT